MEAGDEVKVGDRLISARTKKHVDIALNQPVGIDARTWAAVCGPCPKRNRSHCDR